MKKAIVFLLSLCILLSLCACTQRAESAPQTAAVTVTDMCGKTVSLEKPASRIVALTAADCEIVCALGGASLLVGRGEYCDYPEEILSLPAVQSGLQANMEMIIALQPELVIMSHMDQTEEQIAQLENAGIAVAASYAQDIDGVYEAISMIGSLIGADAEAEALCASMQEEFSALCSHKEENAGKTVYFEVSPLQWGLWAAGKGSFMDEIATMLGLTNVFSDVDSWGEVSEEQVLSRNPDYIVTIGMYDQDGLSPADEILSRNGWSEISAVKNRKILNLTDNELSRPSPRLVVGAEALLQFVTE